MDQYPILVSVPITKESIRVTQTALSSVQVKWSISYTIVILPFFVVVSVSSNLFDGALYVDLEFFIKAKLSVILEISLVMPMN